MKPDDIPQDVWNDAHYAFIRAPEYSALLHEDVARAILAERKRCARVVEDYAKQFPSYPEFDQIYNAVAAVGRAIAAAEAQP